MKRGQFYYTNFYFKGKRYRKSTGATEKSEAEQVEARLKRRLFEQDRLGIKPKTPWDKAAVKFLREKQELRSYPDIYSHIDILTNLFARNTPDIHLEDIDRNLIDDILDEYQDERECSNARRNRIASTLRSLFNLAQKEWEWIDRVPNIRFLDEGNREPRWLKPEEAQRLIDCAPKHLKDPIRFSLLTGVRKSNCLGMQWEWIVMKNRQAFIPAHSAKGKRTIRVPLNEEALQIIRNNVGNHPEYVFTYHGKPFVQIDNKDTWKPLIERAGLTPFRWHDLRHTWASWHIMRGTTPSELMELGGWTSLKMVQRYAHLAESHLHQAAKNISLRPNTASSIHLERND
ncbi:tyrosine-type recombinase/integrase [Pleionea sediminis]|uniref:tyrosine-type recombinase/integrase n=1 Tax=Pleionea sediminis TaxID=2569479 RepID=UPI003CCC7AE5